MTAPGVGEEGGGHRGGNGQREVHPAGTGEGTRAHQHGDRGRGQPGLDRERPTEEHDHSV